MTQSIILGIGSGRCGLASLAQILNKQTESQSSYKEPPLLPWRPVDAARVIRERFARFRRHGKKRLLGDTAAFYLPYIEEIIAAEPDVRIACLKRPKEEVVASKSVPRQSRLIAELNPICCLTISFRGGTRSRACRGSRRWGAR
jgi:hypothetical protein